MKILCCLLLVILLASCRDSSSGPPENQSLIIVSVHYQNQAYQGIPVLLVQTGDSVQTGANGIAMFPVSTGKYTVRVYQISGRGPGSLNGVDYSVTAPAGKSALVDINVCLACL